MLNGIISNGKPVEFDACDLVVGRKITGAFFGGYQSRNDANALIDEYVKGNLMVDEFITGTMGIDDVPKAFDLLLQGKALRTVILMDK